MKRHLAIFQMGKRGLTSEFIEALRKTFKNREMVRISLLKSCTRDRDEVKKTAENLCEQLKDVGKIRSKIIGFTIILKKWRK